MSEMTMEAEIMAANRILTEERMDIDREEMTAAIRKLIDAAQFRIKRKPEKVLLRNPFKDHFESGYGCSRCNFEVTQMTDDYCPTCGQALDWSGV